MLFWILILYLINYINAAVLRSYTSNGSFNIYLSPPTLNSKTKIEVKSVRPYNNTKLYTTYHLPDGSVIVPIVTISDMDKAAKENQTSWYSISERGYVFYNMLRSTYKIVWLSNIKYHFPLNNAGRGMELSDLKTFDGHLLAPDDKTGVIFKVSEDKVIPWIINADGDGNLNQLYKAEWMTVKDEELYVGGYGKEYTTPTGEFMNNNPMWIKVITRFGEIKSENWEEKYKKIRASIGIQFPNYVIHESCQWSSIHRKWFFLPRRVSMQPYDDKADEYKGSNLLITADENFTTFNHVKVGKKHLSRGFSSFQFLPETNDTLIIALKTEETDSLPLSTYCMIFRIDGTVLIDETKLPGNYKYEGIEFADWNS